MRMWKFGVFTVAIGIAVAMSVVAIRYGIDLYRGEVAKQDMVPTEAERVGAIFRKMAGCRAPIILLENVNLRKYRRRVGLET